MIRTPKGITAPTSASAPSTWSTVKKYVLPSDQNRLKEQPNGTKSESYMQAKKLRHGAQTVARAVGVGAVGAVVGAPLALAYGAKKLGAYGVKKFYTKSRRINRGMQSSNVVEIAKAHAALDSKIARASPVMKSYFQRMQKKLLNDRGITDIDALKNSLAIRKEIGWGVGSAVKKALTGQNSSRRKAQINVLRSVSNQMTKKQANNAAAPAKKLQNAASPSQPKTDESIKLAIDELRDKVDAVSLTPAESKLYMQLYDKYADNIPEDIMQGVFSQVKHLHRQKSRNNQKYADKISSQIGRNSGAVKLLTTAQRNMLNEHVPNWRNGLPEEQAKVKQIKKMQNNKLAQNLLAKKAEGNLKYKRVLDKYHSHITKKKIQVSNLNDSTRKLLLEGYSKLIANARASGGEALILEAELKYRPILEQLDESNT